MRPAWISTKRYTWEEVVDVTLRARCGEEKGLEWFREHGLEMGKLPAKEDYHWVPLSGRRFPIYFEPLKGYRGTVNF